MGLEDGHPEKEGVLIDIKTLTTDIKQRLDTINKKDAVDRGLAAKASELKIEDAGA